MATRLWMISVHKRRQHSSLSGTCGSCLCWGVATPEVPSLVVTATIWVWSCWEIPFCGVSADGSSHGAVIISPLLIQYFDWKNGGVQSKLLEIKSTPNKSAGTIAQYIKETLEKKRIFSKCIAFTEDNCNTMFGGIRRHDEGNNVFFVYLINSLQNKSLTGVVCPVHILNSCVDHGAGTH